MQMWSGWITCWADLCYNLSLFYCLTCRNKKCWTMSIEGWVCVIMFYLNIITVWVMPSSRDFLTAATNALVPATIALPAALTVLTVVFTATFAACFVLWAISAGVLIDFFFCLNTYVFYSVTDTHSSIVNFDFFYYFSGFDTFAHITHPAL